MKPRPSVHSVSVHSVPVHSVFGVSVSGVRALLLAGAAVITLGGCGLVSVGIGSEDTPVPTPTAATTATTTDAASGFGSAQETGDLPDPCTLLSKSEVVELTGRDITRVDRDDADGGAATRYCQWQQESGQLALFVSHTTPADFEAQIADGTPVDGVGEAAFFQAGHLYVRSGPAQLDIYSRGGADDAANLADAQKVAEAVLAKL